MDKRAGVPQVVIDWFATVIIVMILIVFFLLFALSDDEIEIGLEKQAVQVDGTLYLHAYLNQPFRDMKMWEALMLPYDKQLYGYLNTATDEFVYRMYGASGCPLQIDVRFPDGYRQGDFKSSSGNQFKGACEDYPKTFGAVQKIPTLDGQFIEVEIS